MMVLDRAKLAAAVAALVTGVFGLLTALGITVTDDNQNTIRELALALSSVGALVAPFLPSLIKKKPKEGDDETTG